MSYRMPPRAAKNQDRTRNSVLRQMALLQSMSLEQLREKWLDLYGEEPPQYKKQFLIKRLAYRIQELFYGGLSEQAKVHLQQAAKEDLVATVNRRTRRAEIKRGDPARDQTGAGMERPAL